MSQIKQTLKKLFRHNSTFHQLRKEEKIHVADISNGATRKRMRRINKEFKQAFKLLKDHSNTVTFFGSARLEPEDLYYKQARDLADKIVRETGASIITGGGPGIMEAANRGAADENGTSIGMTIRLPQEQVTNEYVNRSVDFYYFFSRKVALSFAARAYIYFPGGYGTLDEFFEILTLKQTKRIKPIPIILVGSDFWRPLDHYIKNELAKTYQTISSEDLSLYTITDDHQAIVQLIKDYKG